VSFLQAIKIDFDPEDLMISKQYGLRSTLVIFVIEYRGMDSAGVEVDAEVIVT
jgi:hypothetical protein